jgi:hypothetical protein
MVNQRPQVASTLDVVGVRLDVELPFRLLGHQVRPDERIDVPVQHPIDVADLKLRPVVFDHAVRLHHVRPDLAAKRNLQLGFVELVGMLLPFLHFLVVQLGAQHLHGQRSVLALAAFGLAGNYRVGGQVRDADRGFHLVYILAAFAAGAKCIDPQLFGANVDLDAVVDFRDDEDRSKRSMSPRRLIEGRDADQPMDASFAGQQPVGVFALELDGGVLDARFFAGCFIENYGVDALALRPTQIHAQQNRSPVLGFGAARAGLDGHDGVEVIGLAGEQRARFLFGDVGFSGGEFAVQIFQEILALVGVGLFPGQADVGFDVARQRGEFVVRGDLVFGALAVAQDGLSGFWIAPEIRIGSTGFESFQALAVLRGVKENSEPC